MKIFCTLIVCIGLLTSIALAQDPPVLSPSFEVRLDQTYVVNSTAYKVNAYMYYDANNNRERIDRANGRYNVFCGTVLPNTTTPCTSLANGGKRYIIFPLKQQCCFCCDSAHGCGILKRDWLEGAKYLGKERLVDTDYDKWSKDGVVGYNYWWVTTDANKTPRRLDQNGAHITDYLVHTFINKTIADSIFAVPSYCKDACPGQSICGKFRQNSNLLTN